MVGRFVRPENCGGEDTPEVPKAFLLCPLRLEEERCREWERLPIFGNKRWSLRQ